MDITLFYILSIIFIASLVRSTFGFGESLIAVPLLSLLIPIEIAVPLSVLISIFIAAVVVAQDHKQIHYKSAAGLILYASLGIPIGLLLLVYGNETSIKVILAILIFFYATYSLLSKNRLNIKTDSKVWIFICGFISGILGGAYGLNGPPLVIYGNLSNWTAQHFRATLQAYFLPTSIIGMFGYWYQGLWNSTMSYYFFISLPAVIPAIFIGRYLNNRLKDRTFLTYIYIGLICIGFLLLSQSST